MTKLSRREAIAEFFGTALLVAVVVGSGFMGSAMSDDNGIALLINAVATTVALALLILVLGPVSGAHFNPVVTLVQLWNRTIDARTATVFVLAQVAGAIAGAVMANLMFLESIGSIATNERIGTGTFLGEVIATAGLIAVIGILSARGQVNLLPLAVAGWIGSAYFFTSSTSFANPAVTVGRIFTDSFTGISPNSVLGFIAAQSIGAVIGAFLAHITTHTESRDN